MEKTDSDAIELTIEELEERTAPTAAALELGASVGGRSHNHNETLVEAIE